jgi:hypothetical protein
VGRWTYISSSPEISITPAVSRLDDIHMDEEEWIVIVAFVSVMTPRATLYQTPMSVIMTDILLRPESEDGR